MSTSKSNTKTKTANEGKVKDLSPVEVSLDNADTVIEGASHCSVPNFFHKVFHVPKLLLHDSRVAPLFVTFMDIQCHAFLDGM